MVKQVLLKIKMFPILILLFLINQVRVLLYHKHDQCIDFSTNCRVLANIRQKSRVLGAKRVVILQRSKVLQKGGPNIYSWSHCHRQIKMSCHMLPNTSNVSDPLVASALSNVQVSGLNQSNVQSLASQDPVVQNTTIPHLNELRQDVYIQKPS